MRAPCVLIRVSCRARARLACPSSFHRLLYASVDASTTCMPPLSFARETRRRASLAPDSSARSPLVTMDEILTKLDIVLEDIIGCELEFFGGACLPKLTSVPASKGIVRLGAACAVKVDHRLGIRIVKSQSVHRFVFETLFRKGVSSSIDVDLERVSVTSIDDMDDPRSDIHHNSGVSEFMQGALAAGGGNPALAAAALATQTPSRVAQWITGSASASNRGHSQGGFSKPLESTILMVHFSVEVPAETESSTSEKIHTMIYAPSAGSLNDSFKSVFKKGTLGKLNDLLERCDNLLGSFEPKLDPTIDSTQAVLVRLNAVLERSSSILDQMGPELASTREDVRGTLQRLNTLLDRSEEFIVKAHRGIDDITAKSHVGMDVMHDLLTGINSTLNYVKFALIGVGVCSFSVAYAVFRLVPAPRWSRADSSSSDETP